MLFWAAPKEECQALSPDAVKPVGLARSRVEHALSTEVVRVLTSPGCKQYMFLLEKRKFHQPVIYSPLRITSDLALKLNFFHTSLPLMSVFFNKSKQKLRRSWVVSFINSSPKKSDLVNLHVGLFWGDEILPSDVGIYNKPWNKDNKDPY